MPNDFLSFIGSSLTSCKSRNTEPCLELYLVVSQEAGLYAQTNKGAIAMLASGFTAAPISKYLLFGIVVSSILVSITDTKYLFHIQLVPHIWHYQQFWRLLLWQSCYNNSTELLFGVMTMYHLRIIERLWGSRKFASFLLTAIPPCSLIPAFALAILRPLTFSILNILPAGPTPLIFALLAQYHATIPTVYKYRIAVSSTSPDAVTFSDKSLVYLLAAQLAFSSSPGSIICAAAGWVVGMTWRRGLGPDIWTTWRVPEWLAGSKQARGGDFEDLRRRLEGEGNGTGHATGADGEVRRRAHGSGILDHFRGAF